MNNLSEMKLEGLMDGITTVGDFLKKYAGVYPEINEEEFNQNLEYLEKEFFE